MTATRLTGPQRAVLEAVAAGLVVRNQRFGRPLYQLYRTDTGATVRDATFDALLDAGLVELDFADRLCPRAVLTALGRAFRVALGPSNRLT